MILEHMNLCEFSISWYEGKDGEQEVLCVEVATHKMEQGHYCDYHFNEILKNGE